MNHLFILFLSSLLLVGCGAPKVHKTSLTHESEPQLRIPSGQPESLDPRLVRSTNGVTMMHLIYDGLMRHNFHGELVHALAKQIDVSDDLKTYTIHLRESVWSNGDPLTAQDFVDTWMSQLDPGFPAPNAYQLFVIKGAKAFKEGSGSAEDVGIKATGLRTFTVELENPVPYFLELVAADFYFPMHKSSRDGMGNPEKPISNGPFVMENWTHNSGIKVRKNNLYWDSVEVKLDEVELVFVDENTALNLFLADELHWAGSPNSTLPMDSIATLSDQGTLYTTPAAGTNLFRFNTTKKPLSNIHFRKALSMALDRNAIAEHLMKGKQVPAISLVPSKWRLNPLKAEEANNPGGAWELFQLALEQLEMDREEIPPLKLCYTANDRNAKIAQAVQQQWQKAFGIEINLEQCESVTYYDKLSQMNYDISLGSWFADYLDPSNFLEVFKTKTTPTNNTGWENPLYIHLLNTSSLEVDVQKRKELLETAEDVLLAEMPITPIFHVNFLYAKKNSVRGVYISELGYFDFKYAYIDDASLDELQLE